MSMRTHSTRSVALALAFALLPDAALASDHASISGVVTHSKTNEPIEGAKIGLDCTCLPVPREVMTSTSGLYSFEELPPGTYTIRVVAGRADVSKVATVSAAAGLDENFAVDPTQAAELDDASARHQAFVAEVAAEEAKGRGRVAARSSETQAARAEQDERAKRLHLAGSITMGIGGVLFVSGIGTGAAFVVKAGEFRDQVTRDRAAAENALPDATMAERDECVDDPSVAAAALDTLDGSGSLEDLPSACRPAVQELADLGQTRINGKKANSLAIVGFAVVGGIGLAAIIAGAIVFTQGNRAARDAKAARIQFSPMIGGRSGTGFLLHGRF